MTEQQSERLGWVIFVICLGLTLLFVARIGGLI